MRVLLTFLKRHASLSTEHKSRVVSGTRMLRAFGLMPRQRGRKGNKIHGQDLVLFFELFQPTAKLSTQVYSPRTLGCSCTARLGKPHGRSCHFIQPAYLGTYLPILWDCYALLLQPGRPSSHSPLGLSCWIRMGAFISWPTLQHT